MQIVKNNRIVFERIKQSPDFVGAMSRLYFAASDLHNEFYCLDESQSIASYPVSMFVPKHSELIGALNEITQRVLEAGLVNAWSRRVARGKASLVSDSSAVPITVNHLASIFVLGFAGCFAAFLFFILERAVHSRLSNRHVTGRRRQFWLLIHTLIEGKRHFFIFYHENM